MINPIKSPIKRSNTDQSSFFLILSIRSKDPIQRKVKIGLLTITVKCDRRIDDEVDVRRLVRTVWHAWSSVSARSVDLERAWWARWRGGYFGIFGWTLVSVDDFFVLFREFFAEMIVRQIGEAFLYLYRHVLRDGDDHVGMVFLHVRAAQHNLVSNERNELKEPVTPVQTQLKELL